MSMPSETVSSRSGWWAATIAGMASYLDAGAIVSTGTALVMFQDEFGLTSGQIGQLSALLTLGIAAGAIVGGRLGDRFGRRRVFSVTMIGFVAGALILALATGPAMLYLGIVLLGFSGGADLPVSMAMISESAPEGKKGKMVTFSHVLWMVGILAVQVISIIVGDMGATGARYLYLHLAVVGIIVLLLRTRLPESREWARSHAKNAEGKRPAIESLTVLLQPKYLMPLIATGLFYAIANIAANTNGQFSTYLYVNVAGASVATAAAFSLVAFGVSFLGTLGLMRLVDTRFRMLAFSLGAVSTAVAFIIPAVMGVTVPTLVIMGVFYAMGGAIAGEPMFKVWSQELFPTSVRTSSQGITIAFARVVAAIVALFTPQIIDGGPQVLFMFLTGVTVVACAIGIFWVARLPKATEPAGTVGVTAAPKEFV